MDHRTATPSTPTQILETADGAAAGPPAAETSAR